MKRLLILTIALTMANCAGHPVSQTNNVAMSSSTATSDSSKAASEVRDDPGKESENEKKDVPSEFKNIDFKNFSYPMSIDPAMTPNLRRQTVKLTDGGYEYDDRKVGGGARYQLDEVDYVDLTGDGRKEAIVQLSQLICGGSCDGGAEFFYFYSSAQAKATLLSRIETGSLGYDCGLKLFSLKRESLTLETFKACSFNGTSIKPVYVKEEQGGKFIANEFTRFTFKFKGGRFVLKKREVFPNPDRDVKNYPAKIEISDD